ncbi:hypothetical protein BH11CYA1_BH11CYA1_51230 [soil metagenome]
MAQWHSLSFWTSKSQTESKRGIIKEDVIPDKEIDKAIENKKIYASDPDKYSYYEVEQYYE